MLLAILYRQILRGCLGVCKWVVFLLPQLVLAPRQSCQVQLIAQAHTQECRPGGGGAGVGYYFWIRRK